ncbi:MAG TPA: virulence factor SrfC family protein [Alphaproteobacteria bacterium]|nr:virulence factor SrfC family protein [Alphaproteobacteria bacterium]
MSTEWGRIAGEGVEMHAAALAQAARDLADAAGLARAWVREVAPKVRRIAGEERSLVDFTRRTQNEATKLSIAAGRRMCIGVFGPSQAGKSYLVSRLCMRPGTQEGGGRLLAEFAGRSLDFLREINPPGDKESTGLVTRFSMRRPDCPPDHPVSLRLLSETDLVRILANSYLSDFDVNNLDFETAEQDIAPVRALMDTLRQHTGRSMAGHLDELAVEDLRHYFESRFKTRFPGLREVGYWDFAQASLPTLLLADRAQFYSVLWGGIAEFTELFLLLSGWLERLGFASTAHAALESLTPRERSIIDVDRVKLDLGGIEDERDTISMIAEGANGRAVRERLPRGVLCALVAELHIAMRERSWPLFDEVDLLDFPGARSREKYRGMGDHVDNHEKAVRRPYELFIRGKIAVLFQRYGEERELTSMLLCMAGSNAEVKDLGSLIREWVALTHGERPEQRRAQRNALFFILTKSDQDFIAKDGEDDAALRNRWQRRIYASMVELYQRDGWLDDWDGRPFQNTLLLRNPGIEQSHLVEYQTELCEGTAMRVQPLIEIGHAGQIEARLPELRRHFLADEQVNRYVKEPARAFDALLALNDGGIAHIAERVTAVCDAATKLAQLRGRLIAIAAEFRRRFATFHNAGDSGSREQKREQAIEVADRIGRGPAGPAGLARLKRSLALREADLRELYLTVLHDARPTSEHEAPAASVAGGSIFDTLEESATLPVGHNAADRAQGFAEAAIQSWIARLREAAADAAGPLRADLDADRAHFLVQELISTAQRLGVADRIAEEIRAHGAVTDADWENSAERAAAVAAVRINDLLGDLGYGYSAPDARPQVPPLPRQARRRAFQPPETFDGLPALAGKTYLPAADHLLDWLSAFVQLAQDNVGVSGPSEIDEGQNASLGRILERARIETRLPMEV